MSLLYAVIFATRCRSNHHRLALDALRHLQDERAEDWRVLFLHCHQDYLDGAKAPDTIFKDFKNHVLHVREGEWGGAIEACQEWYRRTVRALAQKDWRQAAWSAGVMSHYYVDPIQPFHTHQSEEEGVIHRAVEWSFSKSYAAFQTKLETELGGYPEIEAPEGEDWLAQMVRAGAQASNPHYETIIDHYDLDKGVKDPPAGLDETIRAVIAPLIGHAAVGLARILDRAFAEAAVAPPKLDGSLQTVFLALEAPIQTVLKAMSDSAARQEVARQYAEYQRTGKVRDTLGEDDKQVRALHALEVLQTPLSSLDAKWPREIGAKAGAAEKQAAEAEQQAQAETPAPAAPKPPVDIAAALMDGRRNVLEGESPIVDAPAIGPKTARRLEAVGLRTVSDLLAASPEDAQKRINAKHISAQLIRDWQAQANLACIVPGLRSREAQALVACGVRDAETLADFDPHELAEAIGQWGLSEDAARIWGNAPAPSDHDVELWIIAAHEALARAEAQAVKTA